MHSNPPRTFLLCTLALLLLLAPAALAQTFFTLYSFNSTGNLSDGGWPEAAVVRDSAGNLYGTTFFGGTGTGCDIYFAGCGTVFMLDSSGNETVLHNFGGSTDGWNPTGALMLDSAGNLYGTTPYGGQYGHGVIFELDTLGNETILHNFAAGADGANPNAGLIQDASGNFYGTTRYGGTGCTGQGCGTVFELTSSGQESVLYRFADSSNGASPLGCVALDSSGTIYGTTWLGGAYGFGTVFQLNPSGTLTVLHSFAAGNDGANPIGGPVLDASGNLYGVTAAGGGILGFGTIFMIDSAGNESTLYSFTGGRDGAYPYPGLVVDSSSNLYGTVSQGAATGNGSVFEFSSGVLTVLYQFMGTTDGALPFGGLTIDSSGNLYGTALQAGGNGWGTIFEIQP